MTEVTIEGATLVARFDRRTTLFLRRDAVRVPLTAIREVTVVEHPLAAARGLRSGLVVSGFFKIGTWTTLAGVKQLVYARRNVPGLRIVLDRARTGGNLDELVLSVPDAAELAHRIAAVRT